MNSTRHAAWLAAGLLLSCGSDAAGDNYGTCDRSTTAFSCIESTGPGPSIDDQEQGCADAGGAWSEQPCPSANRIGCCTYTFGLEFRECFYTGTGAQDPAAYCATWGDGVWTPQ